VNRSLVFLAIFFVFSFRFLHSQEPKTISIDEIIHKVKEQNKRQKEYLKDYICKSSETSRKLDDKGKVKSVEEVEKKIFGKGDLEHEEILSIKKDGKFSDEKEMKKRQEEQDKLERGEKEAKNSGESFSFDLEEEERDFYLIKEDTLNGHPTYLLKAEPKKEKEKSFDWLYWIDQKSFGVLKAEVKLAKKQKYLKDMKMELYFQEFEIKDPITTLIFLPVLFKIKGEGKFLFIKRNFEMEQKRDNYQLNVGFSDEIFGGRR
jgi:hypothetical protein